MFDLYDFNFVTCYMFNIFSVIANSMWIVHFVDLSAGSLARTVHILCLSVINFVLIHSL